MKKHLFALLFLCLAIALTAQGNYYDAVINLTGQQLYLGLRALISTNTNSSYDAAKVELFQDLENVNGNVTCIYTGEVYYVGYNYTGSTNPNTEHTYAQSWFSSSESSKKKADLHHLFPSNSVVNSSRGNYPLFTVANHASANVYYNDTPWQSYRGQSSTGYTVFEPADETKGNIARALLYFNTRYNDTLTQQNIFMTPVLVQWHYQDPPDAWEIARNQGVHDFQNNRNPFVDHPEFVGRIWGGTDADDPIQVPVAGLTIRTVYPNPFAAGTTLVLDSKAATNASVAVFNIRGQKVANWNAQLSSGQAEITWNGKDAVGSNTPAGIYILRVDTGKDSVEARVLKK
jgi:endonuclease I